MISRLVILRKHSPIFKSRSFDHLALFTISAFFCCCSVFINSD
ncbi:Protein of unknown function [Pyronema omphalodes CBS 100304]|uniref:Uncharacterized protein n=1 Tax=Pyronema omphalodes (strain CBS 100304) TaxID=1076935 RepID=U4LH66_PYROM|nr:Protein of unknown function [Pyronema omphalodes CBS 100304]